MLEFPKPIELESAEALRASERGSCDLLVVAASGGTPWQAGPCLLQSTGVYDWLPDGSGIIAGGMQDERATEVRRLDGILTDFLRFARPRRREVVALDVATVLREVVELARQQRAGAADKPSVTLRLRT